LNTFRLFVGVLVGLCLTAPPVHADQEAVALPPGVKAEWNLNKAWTETAGSHPRVCINGLWRWQPAGVDDHQIPKTGWGYFKVPGCWPGITDYMQTDSQTVFRNPAWKDRDLSKIQAAWYQREIETSGINRLVLRADGVNSLATVYIDGKNIGQITFPGGELDISSENLARKKAMLSLHVVALPLKAVMTSYKDTAAARQEKGTVARRGLCGDVYLISTLLGPRIEDVKVETSTRTGEISFVTRLAQLREGNPYSLKAQIREQGRVVAELSSPKFKNGDLLDGKLRFTSKWKPDRLWDLNTPGNQFTAQLYLKQDTEIGQPSGDDVSFEFPFGFREFWIDGKDFYLNGSRIYLSAVPIDNAAIGAASANYDAAVETMKRLKAIGINFVYAHNYDCLPGAHLAYEEILRAADDTGMLVALTMPHFSNYDWKADDADKNNGYAQHAAYYAHVAQNHPSVVFYSTSHNATGYDGDMDPNLIDGIHDPRAGDSWSSNNAKKALRAEAIIRKLDPTRIVYHHAGGNIGSMHTINFYPNFAPIQELSDWFGHWSSTGVKPLFLCEYGAPFTWDWTMYRGWYKGKREFGSAAVPWEFCLAEWNAQFLGDRAYQISEDEKRNLRWEAQKFRSGEGWHRWDYPVEVGSPRFADRHQVLARYTADNWRAYRTWGVSGISPWEYGHFWSLKDSADRKRRELPVDWDRLQRPGFSADYIDQQMDRMDVAYQPSDWEPIADGKALLANNQPVLAYIAGEADAFTEKGHNFLPGQTVEKQLVLINNSREPIEFACEWALNLPKPMPGKLTVKVETGNQARIPLRFVLPADLPVGAYSINAHIQCGAALEQSDTFTIDVLRPASAAAHRSGAIALFDPQGQTAAWMQQAGIEFTRVAADADLAHVDLLVVGKFALTLDGPAPDISRVREGLKVVVFEQSSQMLEKRLGFRATEYGLRQLFQRTPSHPILDGIKPENLHDWRGQATTVPPELAFELVPMHGPTVKWCDIPVSRVWRCGTRGCVASVLIEKPPCGYFRPILDGGYSLQYSPLMELIEGRGKVVFCQLDVTGRTESDPAADVLARNVVLEAASSSAPASALRVLYIGEPAGRRFLQSLGIEPGTYAGGDLPAGDLVIFGPGASQSPAPAKETVKKFLASRGRMLAIGLTQQDVDAVLPFKVSLQQGQYVNTFFDGTAAGSPWAGLCPADLFNRVPRDLPLFGAGVDSLPGGVLGMSSDSEVVFCQIVPWRISAEGAPNEKRTFRRAAFLLSQLLGRSGVWGHTPILERFHTPVDPGKSEKRWLNGLYLDMPEEWDQPYRFFRW
jgi:hypothetical protein